MRPVVLFFKESLLPISETFVLAQAKCLSKYSPRFIGLGRVGPSLDIPADSILLSPGYSPIDTLRQKVYRRISFAPSFHRRTAAANGILVHAHFASGGRSALPVARALRLPLLVTLHGSDVTQRIDFQARYSTLWQRASLFLCVSDFIRRKALEAGFPEHKLRLHYTGIDLDSFCPPTLPRQPAEVLFVGRLVEKKGCAFLLNAIAEVQRRNRDVQTIIIGDGPLRSSLESLARHLGIACKFMGFLPASSVRQYLSSAALLCVPSITGLDGESEGLPTVIMEAQAMGTPVVATDHAGITEIISDGQTGLLAPEKNVSVLAQKIRCLIDDQNLWKLCSRRALESVRVKFNIKVQTKLLEDMYTELAAESLHNASK